MLYLSCTDFFRRWRRTFEKKNTRKVAEFRKKYELGLNKNGKMQCLKQKI